MKSLHMNKGSNGCINGGITRWFGFDNWVDNVNQPPERVFKALFKAGISTHPFYTEGNLPW